MKVINYTLVTIAIIPPGTCSDVVVISPCPAELSPATQLYMYIYQIGLEINCHGVEEVLFHVTSSSSNRY